MKKPLTVAPFRALRYSSKIGKMEEVVAPPYDVISPELQDQLYDRSPYNVVRLILGKEESSDTTERNRYSRAAETFHEWVEKKILIRDEKPALYLYEQSFEGADGKRQTRRGFIGLRRLEKLGGAIVPHEKTMAGPKRDRLKLFQSCHAHFSCVFSLYSDPEEAIQKILRPHYSDSAVIDLVDDNRIRNRLWRLTDPALLKKVDEVMQEKKLFIADGHHRYETALHYRDWMREKFPQAGEEAPFHYVMMYFNEISDPGLLIYPTHRLVLSPPHSDEERILAQLRESFEVSSFKSGHSKFLQALQECRGVRHAFGLAFSRGDPCHLVLAKEGEFEDQLDVNLVHDILFQKLLGRKEAEDHDPEKIRYIKDAESLFQELAAGRNRIGVFLNSPTASELVRYVGGGRLLPPKTTFFYPKLLSGLVLNPIYPEERVTI